MKDRVWLMGPLALPKKSPMLSPPRLDDLLRWKHKERGQLFPSEATGSQDCKGQAQLVTLAENNTSHGCYFPHSLCHSLSLCLPLPRPPTPAPGV